MRRIHADYPSEAVEPVLSAVAQLQFPEGQSPERVQAAVVLVGGGDWDRFQQALDLANADWRDVLVGAGLGDEDWRSRLDTELGRGGLMRRLG